MPNMIKFTEEQITRIRDLKPLTDSKFRYNYQRWENLNVSYNGLIYVFQDKDISRQDVIDAFKYYFENDNEEGFMKPFLLTMIWGFADTGYGTHRTNNYIATEENRSKIKSAIEHLKADQEGSLKKSFLEFNKIKGLGISYLTKVLYFATRAKHENNYALIFDIRVASSLVKLTVPTDIYEIVNIGPSSKFSDYAKFNHLIHKLAKENKVESENLEMYLFNHEF
jgi:hypothetical protein